MEKLPNQFKKSQRLSRGGMAREIAKDLLRRGWVPTFIRGYIGRNSDEPLDSVADETWTAMRDMLEPLSGADH